MKRLFVAAAIILVIIPFSILAFATLAASPQAKPAAKKPSAPAVPPAPITAQQPPVFDGNLANFVWGARLEPNAFKRPEITLTFPQVDAKFAKVRFATYHQGGENVRIIQVKVAEASRPGYVHLVKRHPEILEPTFVVEGTTAAAGQDARV